MGRTASDADAATRALRESEARYRHLFEAMDEGFALCELIADEKGDLTDLRYLDVNPAFENLTGLLVEATVGRRLSELLPPPYEEWVATCAQIVRTGAPERFERYLVPLGRWLNVYCVPQGGLRFAAIFSDVTERKAAERTRQENEDRQAFLLALGDRMRAGDDPDAIIAVASRMLGEKLGASRIVFAEIDEPAGLARIREGWTADGAEAHPPTLQLSDFGGPLLDQLRAGEPVRYDDIGQPPYERSDLAALAAIGIKAGLSVPLIVGGRFVVNINVHQDRPRAWTDAEVALVEQVAERTWGAVERARSADAWRQSEKRFQQFADASSDVLWIRDAESLAMEFVSPAFETIYGVAREQVIDHGDPRHWAALIVPDDRDAALARLEQVRDGRPVVHEFRIMRPSDGAFRWIRNHDFPLFDEQGRVERIAGIGTDFTDAKLLAEHQAILLHELQHRVRNIMAMIRSIAARTGRSAASVEDYAALMAGRLMALARTQALLTRAANAEVDVETIVRDEVAAQAEHAGQWSLSGPMVALAPKAAEVLTLAVHELATNALKYGALSNGGGTVAVHWSRFEENDVAWLRFEWMEHTDPQLPFAQMGRARARRGFGTELIERRVPYELNGRGTLEIEPDGARCILEFPLGTGASVLETDAPAGRAVFGGAIDMADQARLEGQRVLVVEDDFYLAADIAAALRSAGADVLGPCPRARPALALLRDTAPTAAVVDANLGGELTFEVGQALLAAGVPFLFLTGYDEPALPEEMRQVPRLQKPAEPRRVVTAIAGLVDAA